MGKLKVVIDPDRCIGSGHCVNLAPEIFSQDEEEGTVVLLLEQPPERLSEAATEAAEECPAMAIRIEEA